VNFREALDLLAVVSDFHFKSSDEKSDFCLFDNEKQGYTLHVKTSLLNAEYRAYIEKIVESRKLGMRELEEYLEIYGL
jgi:hypothetical protein